MKKLVAIATLLLCSGAWATDVTITNVDKGLSTNKGGTYFDAGLKLVADDTLGLAYGDIVRVKSIKLGYLTRNSGTETKTAALMLNGVMSTRCTTEGAEGDDANNPAHATYVFEGDPALAVVGGTTAFFACNDSGEKSYFRAALFTTSAAENLAIRFSASYGAQYEIVVEKVTLNKVLAASDGKVVRLPAASAENVTIPENVTLDTNGYAHTGTVDGEGKIVYHAGTNYSFPANPNLASTWEGTCSLTGFCTADQYNVDGGSVQFLPDNYASANSKIEFNGCKFYFAGATYNAKEVIVTDNGVIPGLVIRNGWSNNLVTFKKLSGTGTIYSTWNGSERFRFVDVSDFRGNVTLAGDNTTRPGIIFGGSSEPGQWDSDGRLRILSGASATLADGKVWATSKGIIIEGAISGTGTLNGNVTVAAGATVNVTGGALTLATGKTLDFGATMTLVGAEAGAVVFKGVDAKPFACDTVEVTCGTKHGGLAWNAETKQVTYTETVTTWTPNPSALEDGVLVWGKTEAWLDGETPATWSGEQATQSVRIDAATVSGVKVSGQVTAGAVLVVNTANVDKPFVFHNSTMTVDGEHEVDDTIDCLRADVDFSSYSGELGLRVPIDGTLAFGSGTHLKFLTGSEENPSTAYGYTISGRVGSIAVGLSPNQTAGRFLIPEAMYNLSFAPEAGATVVYDVAADAEKSASCSITGAGTVLKTGEGTLTLTATVARGSHLTVGEGTLKYDTVDQGLSGTLTVAKGATYVNLRRTDAPRYNDTGVVVNLYGTLELGETRFTVSHRQEWNVYGGAVINGTNQLGDADAKSFDVAGGNATGPNVRFHADPTGASNTVTWNTPIRLRDGNNATFTVDEGVTVVMAAGVTGGTHTLTKAGAGTLKIANGVSVDVNVALNEGVLDLSAVTDGAETLKRDLTIADGAVVKLPANAESFVVCNGTLSGLSSSIRSDGNGGLIAFTVDGHTVSTSAVTIPDTCFGQPASYWQSIYVGPLAGTAANASLLNQWVAPAGTANAPLMPGSNRWQPALFDGSLMPNIAETDGYKSVPATTWEGWELKVGLVNHAKVTVDTLNKVQGGDKFIGVDETSKLVIDTYGDGNNSDTMTFDIASADGVTFNENVGHGNNDAHFVYIFRGAGTMSVNGSYNAGATHQVKYVEITADEIGTGDFKAIKDRKLVSFTSSDIDEANISFTTDATVKVGDAEASTTYAKPAGYVLSAKDDVGSAQIIKKADGLYVQYVGRSDDRPTNYQWEFLNESGSWAAVSAWKGLYNERQLTWSEQHIKTAETKDEDFIADLETGATYLNINPVNDFQFFFDASKSASVDVDTSIAATKDGVSPTTGESGTSHRSIKVVGTGNFKFNLPTSLLYVDGEGAPLKGIDWNDESIATLDVPVDASAMNGELGLRAKITQPITLGTNSKIVFVKPADDTTVAYPYMITGTLGTIEVRGGGEFIVPNNMTSTVPFEITAGEPDGSQQGAGYIVYDIPEDETVTVSAAITGEGGVKKTGAGTLVLAGECTFAGKLIVEGGEVKMNAPNDLTRLSAVEVGAGATYTLVVSAEQIQTGYNASNVSVTEGGAFNVVDVDGNSQAGNLLPNNILRGTEKVWKQGVINDKFITSEAMAILYGVTVADLTGGNYTLTAKMAGSAVNYNHELDAAVAFGGVDGDGQQRVQIQVVDDNYLKIHEIAIWDGKDESGTYDAIWAKSILTAYRSSGETGTYIEGLANTGSDYRTTFLWAQVHTAVATIGTTEFGSMTDALTAAKAGQTVTLLVDYSRAVTIPAGVTLDVNAKTFTGAVSGEGAIVYPGFDSVPETVKASMQANEWQGTLVIDGKSNMTTLNNGVVGGSWKTLLNDFGNIESTIELKDCTYSDDGNDNYFGLTVDADTVVQPAVKITGELKIRNGFTQSTTSKGYYTVFRKLTGDGTIYSPRNNLCQLFFIEDATEFTGTISTAGNKYVIGAYDQTTRDAMASANGSVFVKAGAVVNIAKPWRLTGGIRFADGAVLDLTGATTPTVTGGSATFVGGLTVMGDVGVGAKVLTCTADAETMPALTVKRLDGTLVPDYRLAYEDGTLVIRNFIAEANGVKYATLQGAIASAQGGTATLLFDTTENINIPVGVTVDLSRATLSGSVSGEGIVKFTGSTATASQLGGLDDQPWTGTVWIDNVSEDLDLNVFGNLGSKIRLTGTISGDVDMDTAAALDVSSPATLTGAVRFGSTLGLAGAADGATVFTYMGSTTLPTLPKLSGIWEAFVLNRDGAVVSVGKKAAAGISGGLMPEIAINTGATVTDGTTVTVTVKDQATGTTLGSYEDTVHNGQVEVVITDQNGVLAQGGNYLYTIATPTETLGQGAFITGTSTAWFTADATGEREFVTGGEWSEEMTITDHKYVLDGEGEPRFEASLPAGAGLVVVEQRVTFTSTIDADDLLVTQEVLGKADNAAGAITLAKGSEGNVWMGYVNGSFTTLAAGPATASPTALLRVEFDPVKKTIRYFADGVCLGGGPVTGEGPTLGGVSFVGEGEVAKIVGSVEDPVKQGYVAPTVGPQGAAMKVDDDFAQALGDDPMVVQAKLQETTTAGLKVWEAYVLGAGKDNVDTFKPTISAAQTTSTTTLKLADDITPRTDAGVTVTRELWVGTTPGEEAKDGAAAYDDGFTVDLPTTGSNVKYMKIKYVFQ